MYYKQALYTERLPEYVKDSFTIIQSEQIFSDIPYRPYYIDYILSTLYMNSQLNTNNDKIKTQ